ncbi:MAG TPA: histidinol-phosphate transaminase [bacterium]|nr:histidinol-phosphate transaminase [bacterium]HOL34359.1 histidinol-phosphate transaminase [bacterium]HPP07496.1 histidinol-phosphate transaminase [bacterium]
MESKISTLAKKSLAFIEPYIPGKPAEVLFRERKLAKIVKLASNENPLGPSPAAVKALKKRIYDINRYPEGSAYLLKEKLAGMLKVKSSNIIVGSGSSEIISMTIQSFCEPEDEIIFPHPSFIIYKILAYAFGVRPVPINLNNSDFSYNLDAFFNKITPRTKLIILCNPNNPTGSHIRKTQLERFLRNIPDRILVLSDEAYIEYAEDPDFGSALKWINRKNVIVARTFSKIYGLAGLRIGYGISSEDIVGIMEKIRPPFNTSSCAQHAALAALDDTEFVRKSIENNRKQKQYLLKHLTEIGFRVFPSEANFLFCKSTYNAELLCKELEKRGIIIRPMSGFGIKDNFLRITIGKPSENRLLVKNLKEILGGG